MLDSDSYQMPHDYLADFARARGFKPGELDPFQLEAPDPHHVLIPILGRSGAWYKKQRCDAGCHPKYYTPPGVSLHLYNPLGLGPHSREVWIAEGEPDTWALIVAGAPALGIPGAETFKKEWALLFDGADIVLSLDRDEAGLRAMDKWSEELKMKGQPCSIFNPSPYNDLNDWLREDRDGFVAAVQGW